MKKIIAFVLVLLIVLGNFSACSTADAPSSSDQTDGDVSSLPDSTIESKTPTASNSSNEQEDDAETEENEIILEQDDGEEEEENVLDGKKVIFIGNSYTYYGKTVLEKTQSVLTQNARINDKGFFYQLCKANGAEVSVTNWTFGAHDFTCLFEKCTANRGCDGIDHKKYLIDRNYDYVIMQQGNASSNITDFLDKCEMVMNLFKEVNPDTKFVFLVQSQAHIKSYSWLPGIKELEKKGVTIVDWGAVVYDIMTGKVTVPGATQTYNKNSFIVCKSANDGFHPNMLTGYITTLMTYCAITGDSAVGQDYSFCNNSRVNTAFDFSKFIDKYYIYDNATTNFPAVFESESDMRGIQQLIDRYLEEKGYMNY